MHPSAALNLQGTPVQGLRTEEGEIESPRGDYHSKWIGQG